MKKVSRERFEWLKEQHWKLWDWLAENPGKKKIEWEGFILLSHQRCDCFACQFVYEVGEGSLKCEHCPLGEDDIGCFDGGLFRKWADVTEWIRVNKSSALVPVYKRDATYLAKQIRDLPWSEEYVEDKVMSENYIVINGNKTELTKEQMKQLGIEIKPAKKKRWRAEKFGGHYYYICPAVRSDGKVFHAVAETIDSYADYDNVRYETKNYFKTQEQAERCARVVDTELTLRKFAEEHNTELINWNDNHQAKWYICFNQYNNKIDVWYTYQYNFCLKSYFTTEEIAKKAITEIGEDKIKEYFTYEW